MTDEDVTTIIDKFTAQYPLIPTPMRYAIYCLIQQAFFGDSATIDSLRVGLTGCSDAQRTTLYNALIQLYSTEHNGGLT